MNRDMLAEEALIELSRYQRAEADRLGFPLNRDKPAPCPLIEAKGLNNLTNGKPKS